MMKKALGKTPRMNSKYAYARTVKPKGREYGHD